MRPCEDALSTSRPPRATRLEAPEPRPGFRPPGAFRAALWAAALAAACSGFASGAEDLTRFLSSLEEVPPVIHRPDLARPEVQEALSARHAGWRRFLAENPGRWKVEWNEALGLPQRIYGDALVLPGEEPRGELEEPAAPSRPDRREPPGGRVRAGSGRAGMDGAGAARPASDNPRLEAGGSLEPVILAFLERYPELFPLEGTSLVLDAERDLEAFRFIRFRQELGGLPVLGSRLEARIAAGGRLIHVASHLLPSRLLQDRLRGGPRLDREEARARAAAGAGERGHPFRAREARLVIVPTYRGTRLVPRLAYLVDSAGGREGALWTYLVAADDEDGEDDAAGESARARPGPRGGRKAGEVLGAWDRASRGSVSGTVQGVGTPGLFPDTSWNPPQQVPLANLRVSASGRTAVTGADGAFSLTYSGNSPVRLTAELSGPYCRVENNAGTELSFSREVASGSQVAIDFNSSPTQFTTAQVNAFREVNRAHEHVKSLDPSFTAIDRPVLTWVNLDDTCNAFFSPEGDGLLAFFRSSGSCANSAYSTVIYHEYGHLVVWRAFGTVNPMPAYNEGVADTFSALLTDQPVIGASFSGIQGGSPIRDLSRFVLRYPQDLLQDPHWAGLIIGGAFWDLRGSLGASLGQEAGLDLTRRLLHRSLFLAPPLLDPGVTVDLLQLDDDDGVLANGTPHLEEIAGAFRRHGLAPPGELRILHTPLGDSSTLGPFPVEASVDSDFDFLLPTAATLRYSTDGGFRYTSLPLAAQGEGRFAGQIPAQAEGTTVRYYLEADGTGAVRAVFPAGAPADEVVAFAAGRAEVVFLDTFDGPETGWTHGLIANGNPNNRDDWQRGTPRPGPADPGDAVDGNLLDPPAAFSPTTCWGNDLGGTTDRNYAESSASYLESPPIDCRGKFGVHLRFRRWLTLERADRARVLVNGTLVAFSPSSRDVLDTSWRAMDHDVSSLADDRAGVRIRFELYTTEMGAAGGWTIDNVSLVSTGRPPSPPPTLSSIEPAFDFKTGGAAFTLRGTGFTPGLSLSFGGVPAAGFTVNDAGSITGTVPGAEAAGPVTITLESTGGSAALPGAFSYFDLPALDSVVPAKGSLAGGVSVSFQGRYYTEGAEVTVGGRPLGTTSRIGHEVITGMLPPGDDLGPVEVVIRSVYGESRFPGAFTYAEQPSLSGIEPAEGPLEGGNEFVLRGGSFPLQGSAVSLEFGERRVLSFTVESRNAIRGFVPPGEAPGAVDIRLTTPGGSATLPGAYRYLAPPAPVFVRGDPNVDRRQEITDAIAILGSLFLGEEEVACQDAADVNDDGRVDVSDPVGLLFFLFAGGEPPGNPHPDPGPDPTEDSLDCERGLLEG